MFGGVVWYSIKFSYRKLNGYLYMMNGVGATKKLHTVQKIGTHDGTFHCDEVLACAMLKLLPSFKHAEIIRTRDPKLLATCNIVVDVGGVYDSDIHRYDHHQKSFVSTMNSLRPNKKWVTKLSSAGLVYNHFGYDILSHLLGLPSTEGSVDLIYDKVYASFVEEVDAIDNGIHQTDEEPRYRISTSLTSRVSGCNPKWNDRVIDEMACFQKALEMVKAEFLDRVNYYKNTWLPARDIVRTAIWKRMEVDSSGEIVSMLNGAAPWKDHLFTLEEAMDIYPPIKYVLYTDSNGKWRVQCVPVKIGSFDSRLPLPESWRGLRDEGLSNTSGIAGCIFVHGNGFIGGNETYEGALAMARTSLMKQ